MSRVFLGEVYKQIRKKAPLVLLLISALPVVLSALLWSNSGFFAVEGEFGFWTYQMLMLHAAWSLLIPQVVIVYIVASIADDERQGQILYEMTRVPRRLSIVLGKVATILFFFSVFALLFALW